MDNKNEFDLDFPVTETDVDQLPQTPFGTEWKAHGFRIGGEKTYYIRNKETKEVKSLQMYFVNICIFISVCLADKLPASLFKRKKLVVESDDSEEENSASGSEE